MRADEMTEVIEYDQLTVLDSWSLPELSVEELGDFSDRPNVGAAIDALNAALDESFGEELKLT